jgi:hypothetical protein
MVNIEDDRRSEQRFFASGKAGFSLGVHNYTADVLDLSLNGLQLRRPDAFSLPQGARFKLTLLIAESNPFVAAVQLVHIEPHLLGLEFYDMPPTDFGVLTTIIDYFQQQKKNLDSP